MRDQPHQTSRLRDLFLHPDYDPARRKPDLREMRVADRRRAKVEYGKDAGRFRTWVYAVALIVLLGALVLLVAVS